MDESQLADLLSNDVAEELTPADVLRKLEEAWMNEKFAPDLLEHQSDVVDCIVDQIHGMEDNIKRVGRGSLRAAVHSLEVDRIRFMLCSYLRCRLRKIENYHLHLLQRDDNRIKDGLMPLMSLEERKFAQAYKSSLENHFRDSALTRMPPNMQTIEEIKIASQPNTSQYVFLKVKKDCEGVIVAGNQYDDVREEMVDLLQGNQYIIPYKSISQFLESASVSLI